MSIIMLLYIHIRVWNLEDAFRLMNNLVCLARWITIIISIELMGKQKLGKIFKLPKAKLVINDRMKFKPRSFDLCFNSFYYAIQIQVNHIFIEVVREVFVECHLCARPFAEAWIHLSVLAMGLPFLFMSLHKSSWAHYSYYVSTWKTIWGLKLKKTWVWE